MLNNIEEGRMITYETRSERCTKGKMEFVTLLGKVVLEIDDAR